MPDITPNLGLVKIDPLTDGDDTFNVDTHLNGNWDIIDAVVEENADAIAAVDTTQVNYIDPIFDGGTPLSSYPLGITCMQIGPDNDYLLIPGGNLVVVKTDESVGYRLLYDRGVGIDLTILTSQWAGNMWAPWYTLETTAGAQEKANDAETGANAYTDSEVGNLAGDGRTTETVKGNADAHAAHLAETVTGMFNAVTGYEADSTGTTDTTTKIQNAIDAAEDAGGGIVFLPPGSYKFTDLKLKTHVILRGSGRENTNLIHTGTGIAFYNNEEGAIGNLSIEDFTLELSDSAVVGIDFSSVFSSVINRVNISGINPAGIGVLFDEGDVASAYYNSCYDVSISGVDTGPVIGLGTGFKFQNSANSNRLVNCKTNYVEKPVDIATDFCNDIMILGCVFENFTVGVRLNGDISQVAYNRFENGGSASGVGIVIESGSNSNIIMGNAMLNLTTNVENNNTNGNQLIFNYDEMSVKYMGHEIGGGWLTNQDMRNLAIQNIGHMTLTVRTAAPSVAAGRLAYADGTTWNPGYKAGLYASDGALFRRINYHREGTTANRPSSTFLYVGFPYFDTTLGKPIWYNGTNWVDATGTTV